jgi:hypothetical protein
MLLYLMPDTPYRNLVSGISHPPSKIQNKKLALNLENKSHIKKGRVKWEFN